VRGDLCRSYEWSNSIVYRHDLGGRSANSQQPAIDGFCPGTSQPRLAFSLRKRLVATRESLQCRLRQTELFRDAVTQFDGFSVVEDMGVRKLKKLLGALACIAVPVPTLQAFSRWRTKRLAQADASRAGGSTGQIVYRGLLAVRRDRRDRGGTRWSSTIRNSGRDRAHRLRQLKWALRVLVAPVTDTIKEISGGQVVRTLDRSSLRRSLTPQCFRYDLLRRVTMVLMSRIRR